MMGQNKAKAADKTATKQPKRAVDDTPPETPREVPARRTPNKAEMAAMEAAEDRYKTRPVRAELARDDTGDAKVLKIGPKHRDENGGSYVLTDTFATRAEDFVSQAVMQLAQVTVLDGDVHMQGINSTLAIIGAIAPENELEAAMAANMAATHDLSMALLAKAKSAGRVDHMREYANVATKLQRTFATQMKALSDWRRGGEQVVRHITVNEGGQAVVAGTINQGGQKPHEISAFKPHEQGACGPAMLGYDPQGNGVPVSGDGERTMSDSRRGHQRGRRTKG